MYVRSKKSGRGTYYQLVRSRRVDGKPRQELLAYLGKHPTVEAALSEYDEKAKMHRDWERHHRDEEIRKHGEVLSAGEAATCREYAEEWKARAEKLRKAAGVTTVINAQGMKKKATDYRLPPGVVYVGRADPWGRWDESDWANPFEVGRDGTREEVIAKYERYLLEERPDLVERLPELRGKVLACWCAPDPCHGDVLVRLVGA